jgi:hypothetical protein
MAVYRGEAARRPAEVHYGNQLLPTACDQEAKYLPPQDVVRLGSLQVTCERCLSVLVGASGGAR